MLSNCGLSCPTVLQGWKVQSHEVTSGHFKTRQKSSQGKPCEMGSSALCPHVSSISRGLLQTPLNSLRSASPHNISYHWTPHKALPLTDRVAWKANSRPGDKACPGPVRIRRLGVMVTGVGAQQGIWFSRGLNRPFPGWHPEPLPL